jgi:hypothetical protein
MRRGADGPFLTAREAAAFLGSDEPRLAKWRASGVRGPVFCKMGRRIRYRPLDLEAFAAIGDGATGEVPR